MLAELLASAGLLVTLAAAADLPAGVSSPVRIGYFHGLRSHLLYRAYIGGLFERHGVDVDLYTQYLRRPGFQKVPRRFEEMQEKEQGAREEDTLFGLSRGTDIIDVINGGGLDGGVVGESSFVLAAARGDALVAVAELGHYTKGYPGRGLVLRKDVRVAKPADLKGLTFATRRSGPGDGMLLREFFTSVGLDPAKDVTIIDQIDDDQQGPMLRSGKIQGLLAHFGKLEEPQQLGDVYLYRKMDWLDPEINLALLVFRRDFVEKHRETVAKIVSAYIERIRYEGSIPQKEKRKESRNGLRMVSPAKDLRMPEWDDPPLVRVDLLEQVQGLLFKYGYLKKKADLARFVDNGVVAEAARGLR